METVIKVVFVAVSNVWLAAMGWQAWIWYRGKRPLKVIRREGLWNPPPPTRSYKRSRRVGFTTKYEGATRQVQGPPQAFVHLFSGWEEEIFFPRHVLERIAVIRLSLDGVVVEVAKDEERHDGGNLRIFLADYMPGDARMLPPGSTVEIETIAPQSGEFFKMATIFEETEKKGVRDA